MLALKALLAGTGNPAGNGEERRIAVQVGDQIAQEIRIPADQSDVLKTVDLSALLKSGPQTVRLVQRGGADVAYQLVQRYNVPGAPLPAPGKSLDIALAYDRTQLDVGQQLDVMATVRNTSAAALPMVMLDLPIPPGFSADTAAFDSLQAAGLIAKYQLTSRQIIVYLEGIEPGATLTFPYALRATMPVRVQAHNAQAYEYYRPENRSAAGQTRLVVGGG